MTTYNPSEGEKLLESYRETIVARELSNSEHFDKAILTYSAAGLALSLSFLKDMAGRHIVVNSYLLNSSWAFFVAAIVLTIVSYPVSQKGLRVQLSLAERYYLDGEEEAFKTKNLWAQAVEHIGVLAGSFFIIAVVLTTIYVSINIGEAAMVKETDVNGLHTCEGIGMDGACVPHMREIRNGASIPTMTRAAGIPAMQAMPKGQSANAPVAAPAAPVAPPAKPSAE